MAKVILFDFWGTLVENGVWSPIKQVRQILDIRLPISDYVLQLERAMMTQNFATLREAFENVCTAFASDTNKIEEIIGLWNKNWMLAKPYEEVEEVLQELRRSNTLILVSNTDNFSITNVLQKFKLQQYFNHLFLSCDLGKLKTDPEFIDEVLRTASVHKKDCFIVGDGIESDMKMAEQAGMQRVLVDRNNSRSYPQKIRTLRELKQWI